MEKLRAVLEQHGRWAPLLLYVERAEAARDTDFSNALENAKSLLESIAKEICSARSTPLEPTASFNSVLKKAFSSLGYSGNQLVTQVSASLATIGQNIGELRNQISPTAHGRPMVELEERNNKVDLLTRDFLMDSTVVVAVFLIRAFEERQTQIGAAPPGALVDKDSAEPRYEDNDSFNDFWDETFGEFAMGDAYSYTASEILFALDRQAYAAECQSFAESEDDISPGEGA
jgi:Abortive infection C-terminus